MSDPDLSLQAQKLIRRYMLTILVLPGIVLSVGSFALGFLIQNGAKNEAARQAFQTAIAPMLSALADVERAKLEAKRFTEEVAALKAQADELRSKTATASAFANSDKKVSEIAAEVVRNPDFAQRVTGLAGRADQLSARIVAIDNRLRNLQVTHSTLNCKSPLESWVGIDNAESRRLGGEYQKRFCSPGYALVGLGDNGAPNCCSYALVGQ